MRVERVVRDRIRAARHRARRRVRRRLSNGGWWEGCRDGDASGTAEDGRPPSEAAEIAALPDGPAKVLVTERCLLCHGSGLIIAAAQGRRGVGTHGDADAYVGHAHPGRGSDRARRVSHPALRPERLPALIPHDATKPPSWGVPASPRFRWH